MVARVPQLAGSHECAFVYQIARSRVAVAGDAPVMLEDWPTVRPALKPSGAFLKHAQERYFLPLVELSLQAVKQLRPVD